VHNKESQMVSWQQNHHAIKINKCSAGKHKHAAKTSNKQTQASHTHTRTSGDPAIRHEHVSIINKADGNGHGFAEWAGVVFCRYFWGVKGC